MSNVHFWAGIGGLFLGVVISELFQASSSLAVFFLTIALAVYISSRKKAAVILAILFCAAAIGVLRVYVADISAQSPLDAYAEQRVTVIGKISDEPDRREKTARLTVLPLEVRTMSGESIALRHAPHVLAAVPVPAAFTYGDTVRINGVLKKPEAFETDTDRTFDYPGYLKARGIRYEIPFSKVELEKKSGTTIRGALFYIKNSYLSGLQQSLPEPMSSLAGGITVGDKRSLGGKLTEQFQKTGLIHIVVLSGYNITLIIGALMLLVRNMSLTSRFVLGGGIIIAFVLMTGASATGVRAGAMAVIALLAAASFRKYAIDRALAITAAGMVLWNPYVLLHDPGFQLSVLATLGLIHIAPMFERKISFVSERLQLRSIMAATLGTQITVLPLLLYLTGMLSFVSLPANLLVLPAIPAAMIASFVAGLVGIAHDAAGLIAGLPAYVLLSYSIKMTELFASVPFGAVTLPAFSGWFVVLVYAAALATWWLPRNAFQPRSN